MCPAKNVYFFGDGKADGREDMKNLLGGKGANLAEMNHLGIPVPPGFTITTEVCTHYYKNGRKYPKELKGEVEKAIARIEKIMGAKFGDPKNPLLVSIRSGARKSMPGMMETILNAGLTEKTIPGLVARTKNERFVLDSYRRLIMMYSDVVMEKAEGIEPKDGHGIRHQLEKLLDEAKKSKGYDSDTQLTAEDLKALIARFKDKVIEVLGAPFPDDADKQLWGSVGAVFASWMGKRAIAYRRIESIPDEWGTAVNVQSMVFGNMGDDSCTGVAFTRNPSTGENVFYGEYLPNAQGEDVVAGIRTPGPLNEAGRTETSSIDSFEKTSPKLYKELDRIRLNLEKHYRDMLDIEFTVQQGKLWMLQCRVGKRNGPAAVRMAVEMHDQKMISKNEALLRVSPSQLDELLHPMLDPKVEATTPVLAKGLPAGPGGAVGQVVFSADDADRWARELGRKVILVRQETSPEDVHGMHVAEAILTSKGGMTSHAALVARGWGKCCIVGCGELAIDYPNRRMVVNGQTVKEGDFVSLNGTKGVVYVGSLPVVEVDVNANLHYKKLMQWADEARTIGVRTNADTPKDAAQARTFGAQGIGLCRTEHMFFGDERIKAIRELIVARDLDERRKAVMKLLPFQRADFEGILEAMAGLPVTIRLLDPPLHEFVPHDDREQQELAKDLGIPVQALRDRIKQLHELNPMLGHRGCRLGISYPEITEMQARAIFEAAAALTKKKVKVLPEVMVPLVGTPAEYRNQEAIIRRVADEVKAETKAKFDYLVGTMIELPRAALVADQIAERAEFFSFGTNDLTQTTFGISRDDVGGFLPTYLAQRILPDDPFASIDQGGVGQLVAIGTQRGRATRPDLKVGVCGEHGGDPASVEFFHRTGLNYVSCSPYRVPIARLAAAQAAIKEAAAGGKSAKAGKTAAKKSAKPAKPAKAEKKVAKPAKAEKKAAPAKGKAAGKTKKK